MTSEYDKQRDIEAEGQRAALYHGKPRKPWPKCRECGQDLILQNVEIGYCNAECRAKHGARA